MPTSLWGGQTMQNESPHQDAIAPAPSAPTPPSPVPALDPWVKANENMAELVEANAAQGLPDLPASTDDDAPFWSILIIQLGNASYACKAQLIHPEQTHYLNAYEIFISSCDTIAWVIRCL